MFHFTNKVETMIKISLKQRRFLIVWIALNSIALFVNVAHLEGRIKNGMVHFTNGQKDYDYKTICLFQDNNKDIVKTATFYPFTTNFTRIIFREDWIDGKQYWMGEEGFLGIFNGYSYFEFFIYLLLGIAVIFLPKLWGKEGDSWKSNWKGLYPDYKPKSKEDIKS